MKIDAEIKITIPLNASIRIRRIGGFSGFKDKIIGSSKC